jgi:glyceraldehyde 3-phosphate dehydrogenase
MAVRVGINGFGRVGRAFARRALERDDLEVVAVNDVTNAETLAHLLEFDSTYGRLGHAVGHGPDSLTIDGTAIAALACQDPAADITVVVGVNDADYDPQRHDVISAASCTTNCVVPMAKVLHDTFGLVTGLMTTIHAYTGDQMLLDGPHKDLRRARSAAISIVPTSTGAARTAGVVIPEMAGRLDGVAVRVPVEDGSLTDLTAVLARDVTVEEVNSAFEQAAGNSLAGVLSYSTDPLVSRDIIGDPASCVFDSGLTQAAGNLVKVFGWYDNEWGYTCRLADLAALVGAQL